MHKDLWRSLGWLWFINCAHHKFIFLVRKICLASYRNMVSSEQLKIYLMQLQIRSFLLETWADGISRWSLIACSGSGQLIAHVQWLRAHAISNWGPSGYSCRHIPIPTRQIKRAQSELHDLAKEAYQAPVPLSIFRSNSKFDEISKHSSVKYTPPITTIVSTLHDSVTVVTCAKYRCDRSNIFETRAFWIFIEFRIRSKYA